MAKPNSSKKHSYPGILVKCESGRYVAYYDHRTDIIANGENEREAKKNLKKMYKAVMEFEADEAADNKTAEIISTEKTKKFVEKF